MRYFLLDKITELAPPEFAKGVKAVALSEDYFSDHFPYHPMMPGSLILEGMSQLTGVLLEKSAALTFNKPPPHSLLAVVERAKFRMMVQPGDLLEFEARVLQLDESAGRVNATAKIGGRVAASATLVFVFREISGEKTDRQREQRVQYWLDPRPAWERKA